MSKLTIVPGCIFHWANYRFNDGVTRHKFLVIVGAKKRHNYVAVIGTSVPENKNFNPGCQGSYYHIPGSAKDWFPKDTWLLVAEPREVSPAEFLEKGLEKAVTLKGQLRTEIVNELRNCVRVCPDVSDAHKQLL